MLGSVLAGRLILPGHGYTPANGYPALSLADGTVLRAAAGTVLYLALIALLSLGVATAVRDSAVAIGSCSACSTCSRSSPRWPAAPGWRGTSSRSGR